MTPGTLPLPALVFLLVHETLIHVRWGELDPYHHVNHATYLSYLEHARIAALESIGWGMDEIAATGHQVVVAKIDIQFRLPALGGNELVVETSIEDLRGASSVWRQRVYRCSSKVARIARSVVTRANHQPLITPEDKVAPDTRCYPTQTSLRKIACFERTQRAFKMCCSVLPAARSVAPDGELSMPRPLPSHGRWSESVTRDRCSLRQYLARSLLSDDIAFLRVGLSPCPFRQWCNDAGMWRALITMPRW